MYLQILCTFDEIQIYLKHFSYHIRKLNNKSIITVTIDDLLLLTGWIRDEILRSRGAIVIDLFSHIFDFYEPLIG